MVMRIAAERREDGVFVAAGIELIEPEQRGDTKTGREWVIPSKAVKLGERLGWQTQNRLRAAVPDVARGYQTGPNARFLLACHCGAAFVGAAQAVHCPPCKRAAALAATRAAVRRIRARRRSALPLACRQCGAPMTAKRSTRIFCSGNCRVAAHRAKVSE
jgi:hypothetical protein